MSSRQSKSSGGRASRAPNVLDSLTRVERKSSAFDDSSAVVNLDEDDPYKFVDSQSLLPSDDNPAPGDGLSTSPSTSLPGDCKEMGRIKTATGCVSTPKQSRTLSSSATGSAKRKQTPKARKAPTQTDWSQEDMELAIQASILEKQREDRRQRLKHREAKAEEDEQLKLLEECQILADGRRNSETKVKGEIPVCEPTRPFDTECSIQPASVLPGTCPSLSIPATGLTTSTQLKSVSVDKLSVKSLQTRKDKKGDSFVEVDTATCLEEAKNVEEECASPVNGGHSSHSSVLTDSRLLVNQNRASLDHLRSDEEVVMDYDLDSTPPISEQGPETAAAMGSASDGQPVAVRSLPQLGDKAAGFDRLKSNCDDSDAKHTPVINSKPKSTKAGLSLKKSRKRLSDNELGSFQELPSSSVQAPAAKRPKTQNSDRMSLPTKRSGVESDVECLDGRGQDQRGVVNGRSSETATVSLTDIKKTPERDNVSSLSLPKATTHESIEVVELIEEENRTAVGREAMDSKLDVRAGDQIESGMDSRPSCPVTVGTAVSLLTSLPRKDRGYLVKRRAPGWPLVKVRASEIPNAPSLQAPPGVPYSEHAQVLTRCFNEYFANLAVAQCRVLRRVRWGKPVSNVNKVTTNSLSAGRRTKRSRAVNVPYSEYALDLKSIATSPRRQASPKRSSRTTKRSPTKSPVSCASGLLTPNVSDEDFRPPTSSEKRKMQKKQPLSGRKKLNFNSGATGDTFHESESTTLPQGTVSKMSLSKKPTGPRRGRLENSMSPCVREESPDILPPNQQSRISEPGSTLAAARSSTSPLLPPRPQRQSSHSAPGTNAIGQFPEDDVMMLDLTTPSPPPSPGRHWGVGSPRADYGIGLSNCDQEESSIDANVGRRGDELASLTPSRTAASAVRCSDRDSTVSSDEADPLPPRSRTRPSTTTSRSLAGRDTTDDSTDEQGSPHRQTASSMLSSGVWLDARKPPPPKPAPKRQTKKQASKSGDQSKKNKKTNGVGGGAKGKKSTKKATSASLRMKALIQLSESESECSPLEGEDQDGLDTGGENVLSKSTRSAKSLVGRGAADSTDSEVSEVESEEERQATPVIVSLMDAPVVKQRRRSNRNERVIDLTADSQLPPNHASSHTPGSWLPLPEREVSCPMCGRSFESSLIQIHAEQCNGPDSNESSENLSRFLTTSRTKKKTAGRGGGRGLPLKRGGKRGRGKSYQPSLMQLVNRERDVTGEDDIDSLTSGDEFEGGQGSVVGADREFRDEELEWNEEERPSTGLRPSQEDALHDWPEDGPTAGGYLLDDEDQPEAVPIADGEGGYIIDPDMVSNSPIRSFKRLSDLDPQERAGFDNQFNSKRGRGRRGQRSLTAEERRSATWGRDDFSELFNSDQSKRGRGRYGGKRPFKYDWKRARSRGGRGRPRGRRS